MKHLKCLLFGLVGLGLIFSLVFCIREEQSSYPTVSAPDPALEASILAKQTQIIPAEWQGHLLLDGLSAPYADGKYYLPLNEKDLSALLPRLSWSEKGYTVLFSQDEGFGDLPQAMSENHTFHLLVSDGSSYFQQRVILTGLPILSLERNDVLSYKTGTTAREDSSALMHLHGVDGVSLESIVTFRLRGGSSRRYPKHPYRMTLYNAQHQQHSLPLLGMRTSENWVLLPMYTDYSRMRDKVSLDLWNQIAETNPEHDIKGSSMEYVELLVDGVYQGIYGLVTPMDAVQCGVAGDVNARLFQIYEYILPEIRDAYPQDRQALAASIENKYPDTVDSWDEMYRYYEAILQSETIDPMEAEAIVDLGSLIDYSLFVNFLSANDNLLKNINFVWTDLDGSGYRFYMVPWDLNYTFGHDHDSDKALRTSFYSKLVKGAYFPAAHYLMIESNNEYRKDFINRYTVLRKSVLTKESLLSAFHNHRDLLESSGAFLRESTRWPESEPSIDLTEIEYFITERLRILDSLYLGQEVD